MKYWTNVKAMVPDHKNVLQSEVKTFCVPINIINGSLIL